MCDDAYEKRTPKAFNDDDDDEEEDMSHTYTYFVCTQHITACRTETVCFLRRLP